MALNTTALEHSMYEAESGPAVLDLSVTLSAKGEGQCRLKSRWIGGRGLAVYSQWDVDRRYNTSPEAMGRDTCHITDVSQLGVYEIQWEGSKWNRATRKFTNQTHGYFMSLQTAGRKAEGLESGDLLKYSRLYRSALHECMLGLKKMAAEEDSDTGYSEEVSLYGLLELVWHLCEVLFIEVLPDGCLVQQLLEWIRWHSDGIKDEMIHSITAAIPPENHKNFWPTVNRLVLKGRLAEARDLLTHHSLTQSSPQAHASIDELLRKAPMIQSTAGLSRAALQRRWNEWRCEAVRRRGAGDFVTLPQLDLLAAILCGDEEVFQCEQ